MSLVSKALQVLSSCLLVTLLVVPNARACIYLMGESPDSLAEHAGGSPWNYGFRGDDWDGKDAQGKRWSCATGHRQSPINLHSHLPVSHENPSLKTQWQYWPVTSDGSNIQVWNNGHTIQVQWTPGTLHSDVRLPTAGRTVTDVVNTNLQYGERIKTVTATPMQFHFHTDSEHTLDGMHAPLELHIVHNIPQSELPGCPPTGCASVISVLYQLDEEDRDNPALEAIWDVMPLREGKKCNLPRGAVLDIQSLLPHSRAYLQYEGSLTIPPCQEGLLWHVLLQRQTLSLRQLRKYTAAVGLKDCKSEGRYGTAAMTNYNRRLQNYNYYPQGDNGSGYYPAGSRSGPKDFVRGSYVGPFTEGCGGHDDANQYPPGATSSQCKIVSLGFNNRYPQPLYDRTVLLSE